MTKKLDLRIVKTHEKLRIALGAMLTEMKYDDISVFDLCNNANVRRATFYKHFKDKNDFLQYIVQNIQNEICASVSEKHELTSPTEFFSCYAEEVINFFELHPKIFKNLIQSTSFPVVYTIITDTTYLSLVEQLGIISESGITIPSDIKYTAGFVNGGIAYLLINFLENGDPSKEELLLRLREILKRIFC